MPARIGLLPLWFSFGVCAAGMLGGVRTAHGGDPTKEAFQHGLEQFDQARDYAAENVAEHEEIARLYALAAASFATAAAEGAASTEVFTNAANSYYFAGKLGEAVLYFLRALAVDPANTRAREALDHIRSTLPIQRPTGGTGASIARSLLFWHHGLTFKIRLTSFFMLFPLAFVFFAASLFRRRLFRTLGIVSLVPALALLGSIAVEGFSGTAGKKGVLMVQVGGRKGDGLSYSPSHSRPFPAGTEVTVEYARDATEAAPENDNAWVLVRLVDGSDSWVPEGAVERVLP
jgi:tetratricopeptide (TPR) repeat protein